MFLDKMGLIPWPIPSKWTKGKRAITWRIDSKYGKRTWKGKIKMHHGLDMNLGRGSDDLGVPVYATHDGTIDQANSYADKNAAGNRIHIKSADGKFKTVYMYLNKFAVKKGQKVKEGQIIGYVGGTGFGKTDGQAVHLHYELHKLNENGEFESINPIDEDGNLIDPQEWIDPKNKSDVLEGEEFEITDEDGNVIGKGTSYSQEDLSIWIDQQLEKEGSLLDMLLELFNYEEE